MTDQRKQDEEHLRLLSTFHYVVGGLIGLVALFPVIHLIIGVILVVAPEEMTGGQGESPPAFFGWIFVIFASVIILGGWTLAVFVLITGRYLAKRKRRTFCIVMAGIECAFMPFGTVLGVFTIIVLMRESVIALFNGEPPIESTSAAAEFDESF